MHRTRRDRGEAAVSRFRGALIVLALANAWLPGVAAAVDSAAITPGPDVEPAGVSCRQAVGSAPLVWRIENLATARAALDGDGAALRPAYHALIAMAEAALLEPPRSVVRKTDAPPSGDKHDYRSLAPYWWPDESKPDSLPYIRRDGEVNPERNGNAFDRIRSYAMVDDVRALSLAGYFSGEARYSRHASEMLRVWFVDAATRMNPHMRYAQAIPGRNTGRSIGIIDTARYIEVVDSTLLLLSEKAIETDIADGVRAWFAEYARWLTTHPMGLEERVARNNHGTFYDAQVVSYALFSGDCELARSVIGDTRDRIGAQITVGGEMPLEQERTRSLHYFAFNLDAFLSIARMGEHLGIDLYSYAAPEGGSILASLSRLARYAGREQAWPHRQIGDPALDEVWRVLAKALTAIDDPVLAQAEERASGNDVTDVARLLHYVSDAGPTPE